MRLAGVKKTFSLAVIMLLFAELFAPYAFAAATPTPSSTPSPSPGASASPSPTPTPISTINYPPGFSSESCAVNSITDAQRKQLWDNTIGMPVEQLTDVPLQNALQAQNSPVFNPLAPNMPLNPQQSGVSISPLEQTISLSTLASLSGGGLTEEALVRGYVKDFDSSKDDVHNVSQNTFVSVAQAQAIATHKGGTAKDRLDQVVNQLLRGGQGQQQIPALPTPTPEPYAGLKMILPGQPGTDGQQREITYPQLAAMEALNPESCLLKGTIKGRVSYFSILDSDLTYGIEGNQTLSGTYVNPANGDTTDADLVDPRSNQHFVASDIVGVLSLNGGANILLPSFYEDWTAFTGAWTRADFIASTALALGATSAMKNIAKMREATLEKVQRTEASRLAAGNPELADRFTADIYGNIRSGRINVGGTHYDTKLFTDVDGKTLNVYSDYITFPGAAGAAPTQVQRIHVYNAEGTTEVLTHDIPAGGPAGTSSEQFLQGQGFKPTRNTNEGLNYELDTARKVEGNWNRLKTQAMPRVTYNMMMGAGWMGPARFAYDVASRNIFEAHGFNQNKYLKVMVDKPVAEKFRTASDFFVLGDVQEAIAEWTGSQTTTPKKAFQAGTVVLANYAEGSALADESTTTLASTGGWQIETRWKGASYSVNFENLKGGKPDKFTSLPIVTNEILPNAVVNKKVAGGAYNYLLTLVGPLIILRNLGGAVGNTLGVAGTVIVSDYILEVDPNLGKNTACDKKDLDEFKRIYRNAIIGGYAITIATSFIPFLPFINSANLLWRSFSFGSRIVGDLNAWVNPAQAYQWYIGNKANVYVGNCKDSQYKILSYQTIPNPDVNATKTSTAQSGAAGAVQNIQGAAQNFASSLGQKNTVENELQKYTEILNLKTKMTDQSGFVKPRDVLVMHIEKSAWSIPGNVFGILNKTGCLLNECDPQLGGSAICVSPDGIKKYNRDGSIAFNWNDFYSKLRGASILRSQSLARMIIPNTIITAALDCGDKTFIGIDASGSASIADTSCSAGDCLTRQLKTMIPDFQGTDLSKAIGKVASVETTFGLASFSGDSISFTRTSIGAAGEKIRAPTLDEAARSTGLGSTSAGARLNVLGNGNAVLFSPGPSGRTDMGVLRTIFGDKGKIEYDPVAKKLFVFIYVLAETKAQTISDITGRVSTVSANGKTIPVINFDVRGKTGYEDLAKKLQDALNKIQQDSAGGKGGFQVFDTPTGTYYIRDDGTIRFVDKKTGQVQDFKITGQPFTDANGNIVYPTDKGNISFKPGIGDSGQPVININGAGLKDSGTLEAAKGPGGIFTFNPSTGAITVYNGQDIPMDPRFATQGINFAGGADGTHGTPAQNPFVLPPAATDDGFQRKNNGLILPAWPEQAIWFTAMLGLILVGVMLVRSRFSPSSLPRKRSRK